MNPTHLVRIATLVASTGIALAQTPGPRGLAWTHANGSESWTARVVAIGDHGTQVFTEFGPYSDFTRLFSSYDVNPPGPVWESTSTEATFHHSVCAADTRDLQASLYDVYADATLQTRRVHVKKYSRSEASLDWTYVWPVLTAGTDSLGIRMARDGSRIVAVVHNQVTNKADIKVFSPLSSTPLLEISATLQVPFRGFDLSADGSRLYIASPLTHQVIDLNTGATLFSAFLFDTVYSAFGISGNGEWIAYGTNGKAKILRRVPATGLYVLDFTLDVPGNSLCDRLDLSDDGSTLAALFNLTDFRTVEVRAVDLATRQITMGEQVQGQGALQNVAADVSISGDGRRFAVALWGDELGYAHEVRLYARDQNAPLFTHDLPGSAYDVDIARDGRRFAVASKATHANIFASGGEIDLFRSADEDLALEGRPKAGGIVTARFAGTPNKPATLLVAPGLAQTPNLFPGIGTLYIDRTQLSWIPMGPFNASGIATKQLTLPSIPGTTLYFQGFASQPRRLGADWLNLTVMP